MGRLSSAGGEGGVAVDCGLRCAPCRKSMRWQAHPMQARLHLHLHMHMLLFNSSALPELLMSVNEIAMRRV